MFKSSEKLGFKKIIYKNEMKVYNDYKMAKMCKIMFK